MRKGRVTLKMVQQAAEELHMQVLPSTVEGKYDIYDWDWLVYPTALSTREALCWLLGYQRGREDGRRYS